MMITAQDYIILSILEALEDSIQGKGIQLLCDVDYDLGIKSSWIKFTRKDGKEFDPMDAFWLGFLVKEYV